MGSAARSCVRRLLAGAIASSVGTVGVPAQSPPPDAVAVELDRRLADHVAPLIGAYCISCHSGEQPKGDIALDRLRNLGSADAEGLDLRLIRELAASGEMPPRDEASILRPTDHERLVITQWLDDAIRFVPADRPIDPGWFTIHRLNRAEYRNTLRDLLGIDPAAVDLSARLPRDDTGYGFDNIADVLSVSPLAVEQYLDAAERAIEIGLGPVVEFGDRPRDLRPLNGDGGQPLPRGGFVLYAAGAANGTCRVPLAADYLIRVRAWETHAGGENARLSLRIGQRHVEDFTVSGTREAPQEFEARVRLDRGEHTIGAAFINDYYVPNVADRNLGIESISVAGPLDPAGAVRPDAWTRVFGKGPISGLTVEEEGPRAEAILAPFADRAYRRPAEAPRVAALLRVFRTRREAGDGFEPAVRTALAAAMVSPRFLFRTVAHPDAANPDAPYTLDGYELASRLSYFLWSSMPDDALLAAAADGSLLNEDGLAAQVRRMIADARADAFIENFAGQWLQLRALGGIAIDPARFPEYDGALRADMVAEATFFFGDVLRSDRSVVEFIRSDHTYLNARLASLYGVRGVKGETFQRVALPDGSPRGGVLTMGAVLTLTSNPTRTSPVKRGLFVLDQMLGVPPPPPPPDVPPLEQSAGPSATAREQLALHLSNATCASCHSRLDPLGMAFENFDAIGRWRDTEDGRAIEASGTLPGGERLGGADDVKRTLLERADQFVEALCAKVLTYALGRGPEPFDRPAIRQIAARTRARGDRFQSLIESVVLSETFRTCRGRETKP